MKKLYFLLFSIFLSFSVLAWNEFTFTYGTGFSSSSSSISFGYNVVSYDVSSATTSGGNIYGRILFIGSTGNHYIKSFAHRFSWSNSGVITYNPVTYTDNPVDPYPTSWTNATGNTTVTIPVNTQCLSNGTYTVRLELYASPPFEVPHNSILYFVDGAGSTINYFNGSSGLYHSHPGGLQVDGLNESYIGTTDIGTFTVSSGGSFAGATSIMPGNCTTLPVINTTTTGGTSPYTLYYWNGSGTSGSVSSSSPAVSLPGLTHGTYNLAMVDGNGCRWDYTATTVKPTTTVTVTPMSQIICKENCITLSANPSGGGTGYTYTWNYSRPGVAPSTISTTQTFKTMPQSSTSAYTANTYTVAMSNAYCSATNSTVQTVKRSCLGSGACSQNNNPVSRLADDLNEDGHAFTSIKPELFPNPAANLLHIRFGEPEVENTRIEVYDVMGKLLKMQTVATGTVSMEMDISSLPEGLYLLRLVTPDAVLFTGKFMHQ